MHKCYVIDSYCSSIFYRLSCSVSLAFVNAETFLIYRSTVLTPKFDVLILIQCHKQLISVGGQSLLAALIHTAWPFLCYQCLCTDKQAPIYRVAQNVGRKLLSISWQNIDRFKKIFH